KENQTTCQFWPKEGVAQQQACTHAIGLPVNSCKMELGLLRNASGSYDLVGDELLMKSHTCKDGPFWLKHIMGRETNPLGKDFGRFIQLYGAHKATIEAQRRGWIVRRQEVGGKIQLSVTGM